MHLTDSAAERDLTYPGLRIESVLDALLAIPAGATQRVDDGQMRAYCLERGCCDLQLAERPSSVHLQPGELVILTHGIAHELRAAAADKTGIDEAWVSSVTFQIVATDPSESLHQVPQILVFPLANAGRPRTSCGPASRFNTAQLLSDARRLPIVNRLIEITLIDALDKLIARDAAPPRNVNKSFSDACIIRAQRVLSERFREPWTVALLAHEVDLSRSVLAARFTEIVGIPPMQYVAECRMQHGAQLLAEGELLIKQIARRVGFSSASTFSTAFKRWSGMSPAEYRHAATQDGDAQGDEGPMAGVVSEFELAAPVAENAESSC